MVATLPLTHHACEWRKHEQMAAATTNLPAVADKFVDKADRAARDMAAAGLANAFSSALLNPSDVTKIRLQSPGGSELYPRGLSDVVPQIIKHEGASALWLTGLPPSMLREVFYSTTRMGLYPYVKSALGSNHAAARTLD